MALKQVFHELSEKVNQNNADYSVDPTDLETHGLVVTHVNCQPSGINSNKRFYLNLKPSNDTVCVEVVAWVLGDGNFDFRITTNKGSDTILVTAEDAQWNDPVWGYRTVTNLINNDIMKPLPYDVWLCDRESGERLLHLGPALREIYLALV